MDWPSSWRLLVDPPTDGVENMARDQWCLEQAGTEGVATLRLYEWSRPTLSLGRGQRIAGQVDTAACAREGIPLVRRQTGGRAVLHGHDLTYAVAAPLPAGRYTPGIQTIYRELAQVFLDYFHELGLSPEAKPYRAAERADAASAACFATPAAFEILVGGKKLVGSAQRLQAGAFLQHGSIPLAPQDEMLERVLVDVPRHALRAQMTDLRTLGVVERVTVAALRLRLAQAVERTLGISLEHRAWRPEEQAAAARRAPDFAVMAEPLAPEAPPAPAGRVAP